MTTALALPGVTSAPHFDRTAFRVKRIFATLVADGRSANLKLTPDEQEFKCQLAPEIFSPLDNTWGRQGWTVMVLAPASDEDLASALAMAHAQCDGGGEEEVVRNPAKAGVHLEISGWAPAFAGVTSVGEEYLDASIAHSGKFLKIRRTDFAASVPGTIQSALSYCRCGSASPNGSSSGAASRW